MAEHDSAYKHLFSHPEMVIDLLRGFVHEEWVERIDYATLEKVNGSYIADDLREREDDLIWRVRHQNGWLYVYLLLEFQSQVDRYMALRVLVYTGLLYQDLLKSGSIPPGQKLPPVFPLVLYNGEGRWTAARDLAELIEPLPGSLAAYRPSQRHFVLDEGQLAQTESLPENNTLSDLIRLETSPEPEALRHLVSTLAQRMKAARHASLRRALVVWIHRVLLQRLIRGETLPAVNDLQELNHMLAERVVQWTEKWKQEGLQQGLQEGLQKGIQEGRQEGLQKGIQEGREEGKRNLLKRQLTRRFGAIDPAILQRLDSATSDQLEQWGLNLLDATSWDEVFREVREG